MLLRDPRVNGWRTDKDIAAELRQDEERSRITLPPLEIPGGRITCKAGVFSGFAMLTAIIATDGSGYKSRMEPNRRYDQCELTIKFFSATGYPIGEAPYIDLSSFKESADGKTLFLENQDVAGVGAADIRQVPSWKVETNWHD